MWRYLRRTARINNLAGTRLDRGRPVRFVRGVRGSIALETTLMLPVFLLLAFFLVFLVQTSVTEIALRGTLSQTARLAASSWYPLSRMQKEREARLSDQDARKEAAGEWARLLPPPLGEWLAEAADGNGLPNKEAAKAAFGALAVRLADSRHLDSDRFRLVDVELPAEGDSPGAFLTLEAEYRLPFRVPFSGRPLTIRAQVRERAWTGGSPSRARRTDDASEELRAAFVSLEPQPVRPGRKATLVLQTGPGTVLDLSVMYKSGKSQAKHLGTAVADESGRISWTWHVSGNTASGTWSWEVRNENGAYALPFQVSRMGE